MKDKWEVIIHRKKGDRPYKETFRPQGDEESLIDLTETFSDFLAQGYGTFYCRFKPSTSNSKKKESQ